MYRFFVPVISELCFELLLLRLCYGFLLCFIGHTRTYIYLKIYECLLQQNLLSHLNREINFNRILYTNAITHAVKYVSMCSHERFRDCVHLHKYRYLICGFLNDKKLNDMGYTHKFTKIHIYTYIFLAKQICFNYICDISCFKVKNSDQKFKLGNSVQLYATC